MNKEFPLFTQERIDELKEKFEELWLANPQGNKEYARNIFLAKEKDKLILGEDCIKKYIQYVKVLAPFQNGKWTKKDKVLKDPEDYLRDNEFLRSYAEIIPPNPQRDEYLYNT